MRLPEGPLKSLEPSGDVPARAGSLHEVSPGHSLATRSLEGVHDPSIFLQVSYKIPLPSAPPGAWFFPSPVFLDSLVFPGEPGLSLSSGSQSGAWGLVQGLGPEGPSVVWDSSSCRSRTACFSVMKRKGFCWLSPARSPITDGLPGLPVRVDVFHLIPCPSSAAALPRAALTRRCRFNAGPVSAHPLLPSFLLWQSLYHQSRTKGTREHPIRLQ